MFLIIHANDTAHNNVDHLRIGERLQFFLYFRFCVILTLVSVTDTLGIPHRDRAWLVSSCARCLVECDRDTHNYSEPLDIRTRIFVGKQPGEEEVADFGYKILKLVKLTRICMPKPEFQEQNKSSLISVHGAYVLHPKLIVSNPPYFIDLTQVISQ